MFNYIKKVKEEKTIIAKTGKKTSYSFNIHYDETYHYPKYVEIHQNIITKRNVGIPYSEKIEISDFSLQE